MYIYVLMSNKNHFKFCYNNITIYNIYNIIQREIVVKRFLISQIYPSIIKFRNRGTLIKLSITIYITYILRNCLQYYKPFHSKVKFKKKQVQLLISKALFYILYTSSFSSTKTWLKVNKIISIHCTALVLLFNEMYSRPRNFSLLFVSVCIS